MQGLSAPVIDARLRVYVTSGGADGGTVHAVPSEWVEREITWSNAPPVSSGALVSAGPSVTGTWVELVLPTSLYAAGTGRTASLWSDRTGTPARFPTAAARACSLPSSCSPSLGRGRPAAPLGLGALHVRTNPEALALDQVITKVLVCV